MHARTQIEPVMIVSFPPQMHLSEVLRLHVQVRAVGLG